MTSVKVKFRQSNVVGQPGHIYYQIIHDRSIRQIGTDYKVYPSEWNDDYSMVVAPQADDRKDKLNEIRDFIQVEVRRLNRIVSRLALKPAPYTADDVVAEFEHQKAHYTLSNFMQSAIDRLKRNGKISTALHYRSALNSFMTFRRGADIMLDAICSEVIEAYQAWMSNKGLVPNSTSFYMRILRAVYNRAVEADIIDNRFPFRRVYTGVDKTVKRALPLKALKKIKALDLAQSPSLEFARDMFLLSFLLRGMSFIDMCYLKKSDLRCGVLSYRRRKTGQMLSIAWSKEMQSIVDKYPSSPTNYLLPIITHNNGSPRNIYLYKSYQINRSLKKIARLAGVGFPITLYVARHSWASTAKFKGIPVSVISQGMGHDSEATTQIYLASLDSSVVDKANAIIMKALY